MTMRPADGAVVGQLGLGDDVLVPAGEVLGSGGERWGSLLGHGSSTVGRGSRRPGTAGLGRSYSPRCLWISSTRCSAGVGVVALDAWSSGPVASRPLRWPSSMSARAMRRVDAVLVDELGPLHQRARPSRPRARRRRCGPATNRWPRLLPAAMPMSASAGLAGPVDDARP